MFPKNLYPSVTHDLQMPFKSNDQILRTLSNRRIDTDSLNDGRNSTRSACFAGVDKNFYFISRKNW